MTTSNKKRVLKRLDKAVSKKQNNSKEKEMKVREMKNWIEKTAEDIEKTWNEIEIIPDSIKEDIEKRWDDVTIIPDNIKEKWDSLDVSDNQLMVTGLLASAAAGAGLMAAIPGLTGVAVAGGVGYGIGKATETIIEKKASKEASKEASKAILDIFQNMSK